MKKNLFSIIVRALLSGIWLLTSVTGQTRPQDVVRRTATQELSVKVTTEIVNLLVTVTDRRNVAVAGLEPQHFQVYEDNVQRRIEYFQCVDEPLSIGIIYDLSGSMKKKLAGSREAVNAFMQASHPDDDFFLLGFNQRCNLLADFADADAITARLRTSQAEGSTALYDAVYLGIEKLRVGRHAKRALLIVSDGADNASRFSRGELYQRLREENILVYCLGYKMWLGEDCDWERNTLEDLARMTGGGAFFPDSAAELEQAVSTIALELRQQYSLAYTARAGDHDKQWRHIKVRVIPPTRGLKLRVRAREGYYATIGTNQ
ncbi:MAG: VWA domain-containing protein [Blastocatellia bacterium]|nr:VWA domain-containing protein [Blastocatellia bacterium]